MRVVTTSWDDGDRADLKVAELLGERGLPGTFYVPLTSQVTSTRLAVSELTFLADNGFEIGAHTFSHRTLTQLRLEEIRREVTTCKSALEQIIGKPVSVFCYPNGRYTQDTITELKRAGYDGARTTRMLSCAQNFPPFKMPVSLQAYPHARSTYLRNLLRAPTIPRWRLYLTHGSRCSGWVELAKRLFDQVLHYGGVWHLYGHSWEIETLQLWPGLREVLDYVTERDEVTYVSNGDPLSLRNGQESKFGAHKIHREDGVLGPLCAPARVVSEGNPPAGK